MPVFNQDLLNNDQMVEQIQVLREEREMFVAEVRAELNATIASMRKEMEVTYATASAAIKHVTDAAKQRVAALERELAEVRAKLSRYEVLDAFWKAERSSTDTLN
jgi:hypothetical protein